jgi:MFS family permease
MNSESKKIQNVYLMLIASSTLAQSFIWGINTLFLLNAGLNNLQAFAANAFFTLGQVLFEVPTGVVADTLGRRVSYLMGTVTLLVSTLLYLYSVTAKSICLQYKILYYKKRKAKIPATIIPYKTQPNVSAPDLKQF